VGDPSLTFDTPDVAKSLASFLGKKEGYAAAVRFATRRSTPSRTQKEPFPLTGDSLMMDGTPALNISGAFTLVETVHGKPPQLGEVDTRIGTPGQNRDPAMIRLQPLKHCQYHSEPILLLAAGEDPNKGITEATFFGPINEADVVYLGQVAEALRQESYDDISAERAREFVADGKNPIKVWLGLARLADLRVLGGAEYEKALASLPVCHTPAIVKEMLKASIFDPEYRESLTKEFFSDKYPPDKLESILATFAIHLETKSSSLRKVLPRREPLVARAKEFRAWCGDRPEYRGVVARIDEILGVEY
jgi:hypothetical protein